MSKQVALQPEFVEVLPDTLEDGTLYVSMKYATVVHLCCCGCGGEVVTPLSPVEWKLTYDGAGVSLWPSVGNWNFGCRSHYWIQQNEIEWAGAWTPDKIKAGRAKEARAKEEFFARREETAETTVEEAQIRDALAGQVGKQEQPVDGVQTAPAKQSFLLQLRQWLRKRLGIDTG